MIYVLIAAFSFWFAELARIPQMIMEKLWRLGWVYKTYFGNELPRRLKPFDCTLCLSFWGGLAYSLATGPCWYSFMLAGCCSFLAVSIALFTNKYLR